MIRVWFKDKTFMDCIDWYEAKLYETQPDFDKFEDLSVTEAERDYNALYS